MKKFNDIKDINDNLTKIGVEKIPEGINIDPSEIISFCGAHAVVSDPSVTVTVGEACVLGVCQTTTTTTAPRRTTWPGSGSWLHRTVSGSV